MKSKGQTTRVDTKKKENEMKEGTKRQRKRGKTLLTSTEGQEEEQVTTSLFRVQKSASNKLNFLL